MKMAERQYYIVEICQGVEMTLHGPYMPRTFQSHVNRVWREVDWDFDYAGIVKLENGKLEVIPYNPEACENMKW